jgi:hypothetical protein
MGKDCPYGTESIRRSAVIDTKTGVVGTLNLKIPHITKHKCP